MCVIGLYVVDLKSDLFAYLTYYSISSNVFSVLPRSNVLIGVPYYVLEG